MKKTFLLLALAFYVFNSKAQTIKILFDATKAESAGNADWVIDADQHNLKWNPNATLSTSGNQSNAQQIPTPAQSGITASTPETYWTGALSYWATDCAKAGYTVESLPYTGAITYGNTSNAQDLSKYNMFVLCEPNILFTSTEKTAILQFVQNGGGLFIIADHANSDRNFDNVDSRQVLNNLMASNPFGMYFDSTDYSETTTNIATITGDSLLHGSFGNVTKMKISGGSTLTLNTTANASVKGIVYKSSASNTGITNAFVARCNYGTGKVVAFTDSSPIDDSTGDTGDVLYNGYITDASGNHQKLIMNATYWLTHPQPIPAAIVEVNNIYSIYPNPVAQVLHIELQKQYDNANEIALFNIVGQQIKSQSILPANTKYDMDVSNIPNGIYFLKIGNALLKINVLHY